MAARIFTTVALHIYDPIQRQTGRVGQGIDPLVNRLTSVKFCRLDKSSWQYHKQDYNKIAL